MKIKTSPLYFEKLDLQDVLQWNVAATYSSALGGRRGGVFMERIAQAVV